MKRNASFLADAHVVGLRRFREPSFNLLLNHLKLNRFVLRTDYGQMSQVVTTFQKFYWRASHRVLTPVSTHGFRIDPLEIVHAGIHHAFSQRYGAQLNKMPQMTLLAESLASTADIYFMFVYYSKHGADHPVSKVKITHFLQRALASGFDEKEFYAQFNSGLKDPFSAYRQNVLNMFRVCMLLYKSSMRPKASSFFLDPRLRVQIRAAGYGPFQAPFDYGTFVLYTRAYCGTASSKRDRDATKDCLRLLSDSENFEAFLGGLGLTAP